MKEVLVPTEQQSNYLTGLRTCIEIVGAIQGARERLDVQDIAFLDDNQNIIFPPPEFQINGGTEQIMEMITGGIVGIINELIHPLDEQGNRTTDEKMREVVHNTIVWGLEGRDA